MTSALQLLLITACLISVARLEKVSLLELETEESNEEINPKIKALSLYFKERLMNKDIKTVDQALKDLYDILESLSHEETASGSTNRNSHLSDAFFQNSLRSKRKNLKQKMLEKQKQKWDIQFG